MRKLIFVLVLVLGVFSIFEVSLAQTQDGPHIEADCGVYKHLLLIYPNTDVTYVKDGVTRRYTGSMSDALKATVEGAFRNLPDRISDGSAGVVSATTQIIEIATPTTHVSPIGGNNYWLSNSDIQADLQLYAPVGAYDSVSVVWNNGEHDGVDSFFGLGGILINGGTTTFSSLISGQVFFWTGATLGEPFLHEWLHGVSNFYRGLGYVMPDGDADGAGSHGYIHSDTDGWMGYYRDLMQGKVWEPRLSKFTGITAEAWHRGTPSHLCIPGPTITSVKLKGVKKLTIFGANFGDNPTVFINGVDKTSRLQFTSPIELFLVKKLDLVSGNNEVKVVNSNGTALFSVVL